MDLIADGAPVVVVKRAYPNRLCEFMAENTKSLALAWRGPPPAMGKEAPAQRCPRRRGEGDVGNDPRKIGASGGRVEYIVFDEEPEEALRRNVHDRCGSLVECAPVSFAEVLEEVMQHSDLTEDHAREALLTRERPGEDEWRYIVHSHALRERRPTLDEARERAQTLSGTFSYDCSEVIDDHTGGALLEYEEREREARGEKVERRAAHLVRDPD